ncbi:MAG TPA: prolyl oligopeptidase family serine peptidase, partial [bacterium]|nr:prolyl oligopeptidase family serine peptidase [bacterium]
QIARSEGMMRTTTRTESAWRRRFRVPRVGALPIWARDAPDRLLYGTNAPGKWELFAWDRSTGRHRQVTERPTGTPPGAGRIQPSGRFIWWFDDEKGSELGRWVIEPFEGAGSRSIAPLPPAHSAGAVLGNRFAVIGLSGETGTSIHLVDPSGEVAVLYRHREAARVVDISRDETLIAINHSEHGDMMHQAVRISDVAGRPICDLHDGPHRGLMIREWSPVHGDPRLIIQHQRREMAQPLILNAHTGEVTDLDVSLPGEVAASWYPDGSAVLLWHDYRSRTDLYRFNLVTREMQKLDIEAGTLGQARVHPSGEIWYMWTNARVPMEARAGRGVLLRPPGDPAPPGVSYTDETIGDVHTFIAQPSSPRPHPAILFVHGGPESQDRDQFSPRVQAWVDHGFAVLLVNYRGSSGYGRRWRDSIQGNPGFTELEDIVRVRDWAVSSGLADSRRIVLAGGSWGGYLTLLGLGRHPELWSLGIAYVPVADCLAAYEDEMDHLQAYDRALFGGAPEQIPEAYRLRSPITYVERVQVPVMILAGDNDPRCPIRQVENYVTALRQLGRSHEFYRYDAGHGALVDDEAIRQTEAAIRFAARHLGTRPPQ